MLAALGNSFRGLGKSACLPLSSCDLHFHRQPQKSCGSRRFLTTRVTACHLSIGKTHDYDAYSGNNGDNKVIFPAAYAVDPQARGVMSLGVGSLELDNTRSNFSTFGHKLELLAPGRAIYTSAPDEQLAAWTGTSMSAAVATGALALALGEGVNDGMLAEEIGGTAAPVVANSTERRNGKGQLDVAAFLTLVLTRD